MDRQNDGHFLDRREAHGWWQMLWQGSIGGGEIASRLTFHEPPEWQEPSRGDFVRCSDKLSGKGLLAHGHIFRSRVNDALKVARIAAVVNDDNAAENGQQKRARLRGHTLNCRLPIWSVSSLRRFVRRPLDPGAGSVGYAFTVARCEATYRALNDSLTHP